MKKVYSSLMLLLLFLGGATGAWADGNGRAGKNIQSVSATITTTPTSAGYNLMRNAGHCTWVNEQRSGHIYLSLLDNLKAGTPNSTTAATHDATNTNPVSASSAY